MAVALVSSVSGALGTNGGTTSAINTTGANLIVFSSASTNVTPIVSDSKGNTYTALTSRFLSSVYQRIIYVYNPIVGSGHSFTITGTSLNSAVSVYAFSGISGYSGVENGASGSTSPLSTGSVTPSTNGSLIFTGMSSNGAVVSAAPSGFTGFVHIPSSGSNRQVASAYLIQTTAAAINPQWAWTGTVNVAVAIAVFGAALTVTETVQFVII